MKFVSWNVNGLRACIQKGFLEQFDRFDADFFCLQETKLSEGQLELDLPGYEQYWCYAQKKGYSGTAIFTKHTPQSVHYGLDVPELDNEGRLITLEYPEFYLVTCYTPNAQRGLARLDHRMSWDEAFRAYLQKLDTVKPVILCGDLNVAHKEIDLKNPNSNRGNAGFSDQERNSFQKTLDQGFTDTFRHLHPDKTGAYSWWSYMFHARENNAGWRIDYFLVSDRINEAIYSAEIHSDILGSDHCPVSVDLGLICNGGIWSPMQQGSARQILPESEEKPKDEKKASAVTAKALVALATVFALVLTGLWLWEPPITDEPAYEPTISIHIYQDPLKNIFDYTSSDLFNSSYVPNPNKLTDKDTIYYCPIGTEKTTLDATSYWLRVSVSPSLQDADVGLDSIELTAVNSAADCVYNVYYRQYFTDPEYTKFGGWLIYGSLNHVTTFRLKVTIGGETYYQTLTLTPYSRPHDSILELDDALQVTTFYEPIEVRAEDRIFYVIDRSSSFCAYARELYKSEDLSKWNSWFYVSLSPDAAQVLKGMDLDLNVTRMVYGTDASENLYHYPLYSDAECTQFIGWLVYGNLDPSTNLFLTLSTGGTTSYPIDTLSVPSAPYLSRETAQAMSTENLVVFLLSHRKFQKDIGYEELLCGSTVADTVISFTSLDALRKTYPAFDVLFDRPDAVTTLMESTKLDYVQKDVSYRLLGQYFYYYMTPQQQADFLTGKYANCPNISIDPWINPIDTTDLKFIDILQLAMTADNSCDLLLRCTNSEAAYRVFQYRKTVNPYLMDLASRSDVVSELVSLYESTDDAVYLHLKVFFVYLQQRTQAINMTTSELVDAILADGNLCSEITIYDQETLEIISRDEPLLQTLLEREDAADVLLNCTPKEDFAKSVPTDLLTYLFTDCLTPRQEAMVVTGLYNSAQVPFDFTLHYLGDTSKLSTAYIVQELSNSTDLLAFFSHALHNDSLEVTYEIYQLLRPYSTLLQEFETRQDAIANLRIRLASNPDARSPIKYLLALYENYPQIYGGDAQEGYRYTLAYIPVSGLIEKQATPYYSWFEGSVFSLYSDGIQDGPQVQDSTFSYLITPPLELLNQYAPDQLILRADLVLTTDFIMDDVCFTVRPCYIDQACAQLNSWLVYGNTNTDSHLYLRLYADDAKIVDCIIPVTAPDDTATPE